MKPEALPPAFFYSFVIGLLDYLVLIKLSNVGNHLILCHLVGGFYFQYPVFQTFVFSDRLLELDLGFSGAHDEDRVCILEGGNDLLIVLVQLEPKPVALTEFRIGFLVQLASKLGPSRVMGGRLDMGWDYLNDAILVRNDIRLLVVDP